jgi:hypothetical protein
MLAQPTGLRAANQTRWHRQRDEDHMQATITYLLTEQAQRAQMAATGQPVARKQTTTVDVTAEQLPLLAISDDGLPYLDLTTSLKDARVGCNRYAISALTGWPTYNHSEVYALIGEYGVDILAAIAARYAERDAKATAKKAEEDARADLERANGEYNRQQAEIGYRAFLADPNARISFFSNDYLGVDWRTPANWWPARHDEWKAEACRRNDADAAAKKAADKAREEVKSAAITAWVSEHGTASQRARLADGLLPRSEILNAMAAQAFASAGVPDPIEYRSCDDTNCPCGSEVIHSLNEAAYATWAPIKAALPGRSKATFCLVTECPPRDSYGDIPDEPELDRHTAAIITIPAGPFRFEREIELEEGGAAHAD